MRRILFIVILLILTIPVGAAKETNNPAQLEKKIFQSYYRGDYRDMLARTGELIRTCPVHPLSILSLNKMAGLTRYLGYKPVEASLLSALEILREDEKYRDVRGGVEFQINLAREKIYYIHDLKKGRELTRKLKPLRQWHVSGPYSRYGPGDLRYRFTPELMTSPVKTRRIYVKNASGTLDLDRYMFPRKGIAYVMSTIKVKKSVRIRFFSRSYYRVYINRKQVLTNDSRSFARMRSVVVRGGGELNIMVKLLRRDSWKMRVLVTGMDDTSIKYTELPRAGNLITKNTEEVRDFPHDEITRMNLPRRNLYLGLYHDNLESETAIQHYRDYLEKKSSPIVKYFLASALLRCSHGDKTSAKYLEGWKMLTALHRDHPRFVPLKHRYFVKKAEDGEYKEAYRLGLSLISESGWYPPVYHDFIRFAGRRGYDREFHLALSQYRENFPDSIHPLLEEAEYCRGHGSNKCVEIYNKILRTGYHRETVRRLVTLYQRRGEFEQALRLLVLYRDMGDFMPRIAYTYILMKEYEKAKKLIFREILYRQDPRLYFFLGLIDRLQDNDPEMYWEKMVKIDPSRFTIRDYLKNGKKSDRFNPIREFIPGPETVNMKLVEPEAMTQSSAILHRNRVFLLNGNKISRLYSEDIVYVGDRKGRNKWSDIRVPRRGRFYPVVVRVIGENGNTVSSYSIQEGNGYRAVNINGLKEQSILHLSYIIDNPVRHPARSAMFSIPVINVQNYEEPVTHLNIRVISDTSQKVRFSVPDKWAVTESSDGIKTVYSVSEKNLELVRREKHRGSVMHQLPWLSFSTMDNLDDYMDWYLGFVYGKTRVPLTDKVKNLEGPDVVSTVTRVYDFVSRDIDLMSNVLSLPDMAEDVLYLKKGGTAGKAILTMAILRRLGIRSYLAFARKFHKPMEEDFVSHDRFSHVLVFVPLDLERGVWLDYSSKHYPVGTVDDEIDGTGGYIVLKEKVVPKKIASTPRTGKEINGTITVSSDGTAGMALTVRYKGASSDVRGTFADRKNRRDKVLGITAGIDPSFRLDTFRVENIDDYAQPFVISVQGESGTAVVVEKDSIILQPVVNKSRIFDYITGSSRKHPLVITSPVNERERYRYVLPEGFRVGTVSENFTVSSSFGTGRYTMVKKSGSNTLTVEKKVSVHKAVIPPEAYSDFLKFCLELKSIEFRKIVFREK